eukprot:1597090-Rhodomonas_salina.1
MEHALISSPRAPLPLLGCLHSQLTLQREHRQLPALWRTTPQRSQVWTRTSAARCARNVRFPSLSESALPSLPSVAIPSPSLPSIPAPSTALVLLPRAPPLRSPHIHNAALSGFSESKLALGLTESRQHCLDSAVYKRR